MGLTCTVCQHPEREAIEEALAVGLSHRVIAQQFGNVGHDAVYRHRNNCVRKVVDEAKATRARLSKERAVRRLEMAAQAQEIAVNELARKRHHSAAATAAKQLGESAKLAAQFGGWYVERTRIDATVSTLDRDRLLADVVRALQPFPEALAAIDHLIGDREVGEAALE